MKTNNLTEEVLETELRTHLDIMHKLSGVGGKENSYYYINGTYYSWYVTALPPEEAVKIARRGNHEEILFMIHQYGKSAPPHQWGLHKCCNPYNNAHILPDGVQEIIAARCDDAEIDAYILYQGFGLAGQRKFYASATHEQRMRYLKRHGFLPEIQDLLRADGNQEEIDLHIRRHGMHSGWEEDIIKSHDVQLFKHCVDLHDFSVAGQLVLCQEATTEEFLYYIGKRGLYEDAHYNMVKERTKEEILQYIARHRYLSHQGEYALCKRNDHDLLMDYIARKYGNMRSLLSVFGVYVDSYAQVCNWHANEIKDFSGQKLKRDYIAVAACLLKENESERLKEMEIFLMQEEDEEQITEYILWRRPCDEAVKILLERSLRNAIHNYCSKWML